MNKKAVKHSFSLLHADHVLLDKHWNYRHIISPYYRLYYIAEGEGTLFNGQQRLTLEAGHIYMIPSFTLCNLHCPHYLDQYFIQFFEESADGLSLFQHHRTLMKKKATELDVLNFKRLLSINPGRGINRSDNPKVYEKNVYYKEYQELNNRQSDAVSIETQGILLQLIARFLESRKKVSQPAPAIPSKILDTMSYIQLHLQEPLTIAALARRVNQHQDYFSRQFLQYTGVRPLHFIHEKRIERAQYLITTTDMPYAAIATDTGFDSLPHFSSLFKKITGITPHRYRQQHQVVRS